MPMLWKLARKIPTRGAVGREDLVQAAAMGLIRAQETFDPARGVKWKSYATHRAFGAMIDQLRDLDHVPRLERKRLKAAGKEGRKVMSIDHQAAEISANEGGIPAAAARGPLDQATRADLWAFIRQRLDTRTAQVLEKYFTRDQTLKAIGRDIGISESRCCQLLARGLRVLRSLKGMEDFA